MAHMIFDLRLDSIVIRLVIILVLDLKVALTCGGVHGRVNNLYIFNVLIVIIVFISDRGTVVCSCVLDIASLFLVVLDRQ